jgi:hypothetical protein
MRLVLKICARFSQEQEAEGTAENSEASGGSTSRKAKKKAKSRAKKKPAQAGAKNAATKIDDLLVGINEDPAHERSADLKTKTGGDIAPLVWHSQASVLSMDQGGQDSALDEEGCPLAAVFL